MAAGEEQRRRSCTACGYDSMSYLPARLRKRADTTTNIHTAHDEHASTCADLNGRFYAGGINREKRRPLSSLLPALIASERACATRCNYPSIRRLQYPSMSTHDIALRCDRPTLPPHLKPCRRSVLAFSTSTHPSSLKAMPALCGPQVPRHGVASARLCPNANRPSAVRRPSHQRDRSDVQTPKCPASMP
jgi:hypothetical protein